VIISISWLAVELACRYTPAVPRCVCDAVQRQTYGYLPGRKAKLYVYTASWPRHACEQHRYVMGVRPGVRPVTCPS